MADSHSFKRGVQWVFGGNLGARAIEFVFGVVLARLLMPEDFGLVLTVQIFTGIASLVLSGGLSSALIQAKDAAVRDFRVIFTFQVALGLLIFLIFYFLSGFISQWFKNPLLSDLLKVSALAFLLKPFLAMPNAILQRGMNFKAITQGRILGMLAGGSSSVIMALYGLGVWSLVFGGFAGSLANILFLTRRSGWVPAFSLDMAVLKKYSSFGIKVSLNDTVAYLREQSTNFFIGKWMGPAALGLFNKGFSLSAIPMQIIGGSVNQPLFRQVASSIDDLEAVRRYYGRSLFIVTFYTLPFYVGIWWLSESFIVNVFGPNWSDAVPVLHVLALTGLFRCMINPSGALAEGMKNVGRQLMIAIEALLLLILLVAYSLPHGIEAVAYSLVLVFAYHAFRLTGLTSNILGLRRYHLIKEMAPAFLPCFILFVVMYLMDIVMIEFGFRPDTVVYFLAQSVVGTAAYASSVMLLPLDVLRVEAARWQGIVRRKSS